MYRYLNLTYLAFIGMTNNHRDACLKNNEVSTILCGFWALVATVGIAIVIRV